MLKQKLTEDFTESLKSGDAKRRLVIGMVLNSVKNRELQKRAKSGNIEELNDDEVLEVVASEVKKRKESIESFKAGDREEMAQSERDELNILMTYMPEQMSEEQIREEARKAIAETGAKDIKEMGKVLGVLMPKVKGKADGTLVSRIVNEELQK